MPVKKDYLLVILEGYLQELAMLKSTSASLQGSKSNVFGLFSFQSVLDHLKNNPTFIDLSDCDMRFCTSTQWQQFGDGLRRCVALDELIVSSNTIFSASKEKYQAACQAIAQAQKAKKLDLSHNFTSMQSYDMWISLGRMIKSFPQLEELALRGSFLGKIDRLTPDINRLYREISNTFSSLSSVKIIDLRFNSLVLLTPENLNAFFNALLANTHLVMVKLIDDEHDANSNKISSFSTEQKKYYDLFQAELSKRALISAPINEAQQIDKRQNQLLEDERVIFEQLKIQVKTSSEQTAALQSAVDELLSERIDQMQPAQIRDKLNSVLQNTPTVLLFYRMVNIKLEEIFIGVKAASSTVVPHQVQGELSGISSTVNVVGTILGYLPWVGNALKSVSELAQEQLKTIDNARTMGLLRQLSSLGTLDEVAILSEKIARYLTICYFSQLQEMKTGVEIEKGLSEGNTSGTLFQNFSQQVMEYGKQTYRYISGVRSKEPAYALAEYAVMLILSAFMSDKIDLKMPLLEQITVVLTKLPKKKSVVVSSAEKIISNPIKQILKLLFDDKTIQTKSGKFWVLEMIFCKPGLQTNKGYYTSRELDPETYGYRWCFENLNHRQDLRAIPASNFLTQGLVSQFHKNISAQGLTADIASNFVSK